MVPFWRKFTGILSLFAFIIASTVLSTLALLFAIFARIFPMLFWYQFWMRVALKMPVYWAGTCKYILRLHRRHRWIINGDSQSLSCQHSYLLFSNHQNWLDILILGAVFNPQAPTIKFFLKRELLWSLPLLGVTVRLLEYPFLRRHKREDIRKHPELKNVDIETTKAACKKFILFPTTIMNFVEGTRFTAEKREQQASPYRNLLKPKAAGIAMVLKECHHHLSGIINTSIYYSQKTSIWAYFIQEPMTIQVDFERLPISDDLIGNYYSDRNFRRYIQHWLNELWSRKDNLLDEAKNNNT